MLLFSLIRKEYNKGNFITTLCVFFILMLMLLIVNACTMLPAPSNPSPGFGSIQISSTPTGASIYLDGSDTGYTSPKLLNNIHPGSYLVTFKLEGYLNSNNFVQVYANQTTQLDVYLTPNPHFPSPETKDLTKIEVEPNNLVLLTGEIASISSITAYYSDDTAKVISANQCNLFSTKPSIATVTSNGQIVAFSEGQTNIWVEYTESSITKSDSISVSVKDSTQELGNLVNINVLPKDMSLDIGESKAISSITAYYDNGAEQLINPILCQFSVNNSFVSVSNSGIITGNSTGSSIVTASYTEGSISKSDSLSVNVSEAIINHPTYRALSIGVGDYIYYGPEGDLLAPPYDVNQMAEMYGDCRFGPTTNIPFQKINSLKDQQATKTNIFNKIQTTFSGADENDVSYFYFSGHGVLHNNTSFLCPADFNGTTSSAISVHELEAFLSAIPGIKVVFIDTCHSGGFIGKSAFETNEELGNDYLTIFNDSIINVFASKPFSKDLLTSNAYQVLTSSHWYEVSYEIHPDTGDPFGVFTQALYEGCSLTNNTPADVNQDDKIALQEAYQFIAQWVASMGMNQNVQVHPLHSSFAIFEY